MNNDMKEDFVDEVIKNAYCNKHRENSEHIKSKFSPWGVQLFYYFKKPKTELEIANDKILELQKELERKEEILINTMASLRRHKAFCRCSFKSRF